MTASEDAVLDPICCEFCGLPIDEGEREQCPALDEETVSAVIRLIRGSHTDRGASTGRTRHQGLHSR